MKFNLIVQKIFDRRNTLIILSIFSFSLFSYAQKDLNECIKERNKIGNQVVELRKQNTELLGDNGKLLMKVQKLEAENARLKKGLGATTDNSDCSALNAEIAKLKSDLEDQKARNKADSDLLKDCLNGKTGNSQTSNKVDYKLQLEKCSDKLATAKKELAQCQNKTSTGNSTKPTTANKDIKYLAEVETLQKELKKKLKSKEAHFPLQVYKKDFYGANYTAYVVNSKDAKDNLKLYFKDEDGKKYSNLGNLKTKVDKKSESKLTFAMNGGMYHPNQEPVGLLIIDGKELNSINLNKKEGGNFGLLPNGVFYIKDDNSAGVIESNAFMGKRENVKHATQSGPMLLIDGEYHPALRRWSTNKQIRNGVGVLEDGRIVFAISKTPTNFYDFATLFKMMGCKNALYLDGAVSRMYCPEAKFNDKAGNFGPIIGITEF